MEGAPVKANRAQINAAVSLEERAKREVLLGHNSKAAEAYLKAGKLFWAAGDHDAAEHAWRRACDFCERTANQIAQRPKFDA
jgi:TolA-binding protein